MQNLISIIIPTKNAASHLEVLFDSLVKQSYKNFEVIINDDKTTNDHTEQVIKKYQDKFKIIYLQENLSMAQGRKRGSDFAHGEYQLHLDADMKLSPKVLSACWEKVGQGFDVLVIPEVSYGDGFWAGVKAFERSMYIGDDSIESARFFKSVAYKKVGGHNEKMVLSEDKDLDLRVRGAGFKVGRISEPIYHNEGKLSLKKDLQKKFFYGKTAHVFIAKNPRHAMVQANLIFRMAYFRNWRKMVCNPILSLGMILMKTLETFAALTGLIMVKITKI